MEIARKVKIEVELYSKALEAMEAISQKTGVTKDEIVEKLFLQYIPLDTDRAIQLVTDDIVTRTQALKEEQKQEVYSGIMKYIESEICKK